MSILQSLNGYYGRMAARGEAGGPRLLTFENQLCDRALSLW